MKILKSQYLKLQGNAANGQQSISNGIGIKKIISSKDKEYGVAKKELQLTVPPVQMLGKKDIVCFNANSKPSTNIKVLVDNIDESLKKLNVVLEYIDMNSLWLTNLYKSYENDLWRKTPRTDLHGRYKYLFNCALCTNVYKTFFYLKSHLNVHMGLYPYVCKICVQKFTNRSAATKHLRMVHHLERQQYNDYLTS